jgi:hypothetical protein
VHEEIVHDKHRVSRLNNKLLHFSHWTYDEFFAKQVRYGKWAAQDLWDRGKRTGFTGLFWRPLLRFLQLYFFRLGFLDGLQGLQWCMLVAFVNSFIKQARLWEMEHALPQPVHERPEASPAEAREERGAFKGQAVHFRSQKFKRRYKSHRAISS